MFEIPFLQGQGNGSDCPFSSLFPSLLQITEPVPGVLIDWCLQRKCPKYFCLVWLKSKKLGLFFLGTAGKGSEMEAE